jgi:hypothetical protein
MKILFDDFLKKRRFGRNRIQRIRNKRKFREIQSYPLALAPTAETASFRLFARSSFLGLIKKNFWVMI